MYRKGVWGGETDPYIMTTFNAVEGEEGDDDPTVSMVLFEWYDEPLLGVYPTPESPVVRKLWAQHRGGTDGDYILMLI